MSDPRTFHFEGFDDLRIVETLCRARSAMQLGRDGEGLITPRYIGPTIIPASAAILMLVVARTAELRSMLAIGFSIVGVAEHDSARLTTLDDRRFITALLAVLRGEDLGEALARDANASRAESIGREGGGR